MEKIKASVGITERNYSAHVIIGDGIAVATGKTFDELKQQMKEAVEFHLECLREDNEEIPVQFAHEYELVYRFDTQSLLQHYNGILTNSSLERLTGINQRQLQRYASGVSRPREAQALKISNGLHRLGAELLAVEL